MTKQHAPRRSTAEKMPCIKCGHSSTTVVCGRYCNDRITKRRYRKCPNCGAAFKTLQAIDGNIIGQEKIVPYLTPQESLEHRRECLRKSGHIKLTAKEVGEVRYLFKNKVFRNVDIAAQYGITPHHVSELGRGKRIWKEVKTPTGLDWLS